MLQSSSSRSSGNTRYWSGIRTLELDTCISFRTQAASALQEVIHVYRTKYFKVTVNWGAREVVFGRMGVD